MTINVVYGAIDLTGGSAGDLDAIDGTVLQNNDIAIVITSTNVYIYRLNSTSGAAEVSPDVISPDTNAGNKRWILMPIRYATEIIVGGVYLATSAETVTGTDETKVVTPDTLTDKMSAPGAIGNTTPSTGAFTTLAASGKVTSTPDPITATSETIAASIATLITLVTTNGDSDLDDVSLADGATGQVKIITCEVAGNAGDSYKVTPATMVEGTQITFAADPTGKGCVLVWSVSGWLVVGNNGGVIA